MPKIKKTTNHGGKREGSGRPKGEFKGWRTLSVTAETYAKLQLLAGSGSINAMLERSLTQTAIILPNTLKNL
jgi:hypothetical protein